MKTLTEWNTEATTRYLTDPEFHARAVAAVGLTEAIGRANGNASFPEHRPMILQAVVIGMLIHEMKLEETGITAEMAVNSMRDTAKTMGMQVVARPAIEMNFEAQAVPEAFGG